MSVLPTQSLSTWCGCEAGVSCALTPWTAREGESFLTVPLAGPGLGESQLGDSPPPPFSLLRKDESGESLSFPSVTCLPTLSLHSVVHAQRGWWVAGARVLCRDACVFYSRDYLWFSLAFKTRYLTRELWVLPLAASAAKDKQKKGTPGVRHSVY